jgi:GT2 family glycosyltransferase
LRGFRRAGRTAEVVRISLEEPLDLLAPTEHDEVLLVASLGGAVIGHSWIPSSARRPEQQWAALNGAVGYFAATTAIRRMLARAMGSDEEAKARAPLRVSVVVCTHDRADRLAPCLERLLALDPPADEILVVDNAPSDDATRRVCEGLPVRYLCEPVPGASRARNRGIAESRSPLIAFTDDDCLAAPNWLRGLPFLFADPMVQAVTGYVGPWDLSAAAPRDFERHGGFVRHGQLRRFESGNVSPANLAASAGVSANMIVRRTAFRAVGAFAEELGPGTPTRAAEDKELLYRILAAGYRVIFDPARVVWHQHRRDAAGLRGVMNDYGVGEFAWFTRLLLRHGEPAALLMARWWMRHWVRDARRWARRRPEAVSLAVTAGEVRGALAGPGALRSSQRSRDGIPEVAMPAAPEDATSVTVTRAESPAITVALASHNRSTKLRETLGVLAAQDYPADRWEVVVALDGCTDDSREMAESLPFPSRLRVLDEPKRGVAGARNSGARAAANPVVVFLDDDIHPIPGFLAVHAAAHAEAPADHLALGFYPPATTARSLNAIAVRRWWSDHFRLLGEPGHRWRFTDICDGNSSIPARLFAALGGFDEDFAARRQDYEFGVRVLDARVPVAFHAAAKAWHHFDPDIATTLRNSRQEGRDDVLLATKHPAAAASLPLAGLATRIQRLPANGAWLPRLTAFDAWDQAGITALAALEAANLRSRWSKLMRRLQLATYAGGVLEALPDRATAADVLSPDYGPRQELVVDLEEPGRPLEPDGVIMPRICVHLRGRRIAAVDAVAPGGQWDVEALLDRLVDTVLGQGAVPWVLPPTVGQGDVSGRPRPPGSTAAEARPRP